MFYCLANVIETIRAYIFSPLFYLGSKGGGGLEGHPPLARAQGLAQEYDFRTRGGQDGKCSHFPPFFWNPSLSYPNTPSALSYRVCSPGVHISFIEGLLETPRGMKFAPKEHLVA